MKKINSSHSTYIENAEAILNKLDKNLNVSKIVLGIIKVKTRVSKTVTKPKISINKTHILLKINSKRTTQEIYIYGKDLEEIAKNINLT